MALQICHWIANYNQASIPASRVFAPITASPALLFPTQSNVLIKSISVNCVMNQNTDLVINDFALQLAFIQKVNASFVVPNQAILINASYVNLGQIITVINKKNQNINVDFVAGGFGFQAFVNCNKLALSNSSTLLNTPVSFLISAYYEKINN